MGRGLISRNADRYQRESELRTTLNHVNEHIDQVERDRGEASAPRLPEITLDLKGVLVDHAPVW